MGKVQRASPPHAVINPESSIRTKQNKAQDSVVSCCYYNNCSNNNYGYYNIVIGDDVLCWNGFSVSSVFYLTSYTRSLLKHKTNANVFDFVFNIFDSFFYRKISIDFYYNIMDIATASDT